MDREDATNRWYDYTRRTGVACVPILRKNRGFNLFHLNELLKELDIAIFLTTVIGGNDLALSGLRELRTVLESDISEKKGLL